MLSVVMLSVVAPFSQFNNRENESNFVITTVILRKVRLG